MKFDFKNKTNLIILLAVFLLVFIIILVVQNRQPPTLPVSSEFSTSNQTFSSIIYSGELITVPPTFTIAGNVTNNFSDTPVNSIIQAYDLQPSTSSPFLWRNQNIYLSLDTCYMLIIEGDSANYGDWNITTAVESAQNYISDIFHDSNLQPDISQIGYWDAEIHMDEVNDPNLANLVTIPFATHIEGIPVFFGKRAEYPYQVFINNQNEVSQLRFCPQTLSFTAQDTTPSISLEDVMYNINNNAAPVSIIDSFQNDLFPFDSSQFVSGNLTQVTLEYRVDDVKHIAYPFYHFSGTLYDQNNIPVAVELITPAVNVSIE